MGCLPYWNGQDFWGMRDGAAVNIIYFSGREKSRELHIPSLDIVMHRT